MTLDRLAPNLTLSPDGTWISDKVSAVSYPEGGNEFCFGVEDSSFWFRHRNACIASVVKRLPPAGVFLDIGGGNGYVARGLQTNGIDVALIEPGPVGARNAVRRGVRQVVCAALEDIEFRPGTVPAAGLFDVLEHIEDADGFLRSIHRLLAPGGRLYLTVPAYQWLWSHEDDLAGHYCRYTLPALMRVLERAGFQVEFPTYFFSFLPLPILAARVLPYRLGARPTTHDSSDHKDLNGPGGGVLKRIMDWEIGRLENGQACPFGGSCLVAARKPA
jgi:SAM-dependent methyltransferase